MSAQAPAPQSGSGKRYRFVVGSAAEAATAIREKLGEHAKVLSVQQIEGSGLARFLRAPKLEVIAFLPDGENNTAPSSTSAVSAKPPSEEVPVFRIPGEEEELEPQVAPPPPAPHKPPESAPPKPAKTSLPVATSAPSGESRLLRILRRAGLPESFLLRFATDKDWQELQRMPLTSAFPRAVVYLRNSIPKRSIVAATKRVAFFGSPGVGATTALCKQLAGEIFLQNSPACVMKLDGEEPNSTEGLAMYCEALGIPLLRASSELLQVKDDVTVYFDVPGAISNAKSRKRLEKEMSNLGISSRVLVINATYERELMQHFYQHSAEMGTTHVVFTHFDELLHYGKLWEFVLDSELSPLFASTGPNLAGDCERDIIGMLVRKTLAARE